MFVNYTNHPSGCWSEAQKREARKYGTIIDVPFPAVRPSAGKEEITALAEKECKKIMELIKEEKKTSAVLCQGEFTYTCLMVEYLQEKNVKVLSAVSERHVVTISEGEISKKQVEFVFEGFREYVQKRRGFSTVVPEEVHLQPSKFQKQNKTDGKDTILIAPMGRGEYKNTTYIDENGEKIATTGYAFDAVVGKENPNKLLLIGTRKSKWEEVVRWYSLGQTDALVKTGEKIQKKIREGSFSDENCSEAEKYIENAACFDKVKIAIIPDGSNSREIGAYFDCLLDAFKKISDDTADTRIIFDISNGYRSIPLYIITFIRYISLINKSNVSYTVYYGMYDYSPKQSEGTPLVNLTSISELTDWINAISEFRNFGSVKKLYQCLLMEKNDGNELEIQSMIREFEMFDYALNSNNLHYLERGIEFIKKVDLDSKKMSKPAKLMLQNLQEDFRTRFDDNQTKFVHSWNLIKLAQLYTEQGRYGPAAIALQEGIITYIMERYICDKIIKSGKTDREGFEEYIQDYHNRDLVKTYFYGKVKAHQEPYSENVNDFEKKYPFDSLFLKIKDNIRNVDAHIISKKDIPTVDEMETWLNLSIEILLNDMQGVKTDINPDFADMFKDFEVPDNSPGFKETLSLLNKNDSLGNWYLISDELPVLMSEKKEAFVNIDSKKMIQLSTELRNLKKICDRGKRCSPKELENMPMIKEILIIWIKCDGMAVNRSELFSRLDTKRNSKGKLQNGYERITNVMKSTISNKWIELLTIKGE